MTRNKQTQRGIIRSNGKTVTSHPDKIQVCQQYCAKLSGLAAEKQKHGCAEEK